MSTVCYYLSGCCDDGILKMIRRLLVAMTRELHCKKPSPTVVVVDNKSIQKRKLTRYLNVMPAKKIKGRKRHIINKMIGFMVGLVVHRAGIQDRDGAPRVLKSIRGTYPDL